MIQMPTAPILVVPCCYRRRLPCMLHWEVMQQARFMAAAAPQLTLEVQEMQLLLIQRLPCSISHLLLHIPTCNQHRVKQGSNHMY